MKRTIETQVGRIELECDDSSLLSLKFDSKEDVDDKSELLDRCQRQIEEFFSGDRKDFDIPLELKGTDFQKSVWNEILKIPFGLTCSYLDIAKKLGKPGAVRAIGGAAGANNIPLLIPCHRVIAADGSIGGFSAGINRKKRLLELEQS